jgi:hypothetical protein
LMTGRSAKECQTQNPSGQKQSKAIESPPHHTKTDALPTTEAVGIGAVPTSGHQSAQSQVQQLFQIKRDSEPSSE